MKKKGLLLIGIGLILIVSGFVYAFVGTDMFKDENPNTSKEDDTFSIESINGIYENNGQRIKIFRTGNVKYEIISSKPEIYFSINDYYDGTIEVFNKKYSYSFIDEKIDFDFKKNLVKVTFNDEILSSYSEFKNGDYKKIEEYSLEDYYNDNIGDLKFFNSKYNGIYENNGKFIFIYQINKETVKISMSSQSTNSVYYIKGEYNIDQNDPNKLANSGSIVTINENGITIDEDSYNEFDGEYTKKDNLSVELAIAVN